MKPIKRVYLSGLGAIGSIYAAQLHNYDPECLSVIVDRERLQRYQQNEITINGRAYQFNYILPDSPAEPADLIIIAVKQHHLSESIQAIRKFVGSETIILSLLNGITSEEIIGREYGMDKLLYSFVVGTDAVREGTVTTCSTLGKIVFGEAKNSEYSAKVVLVKDLFDRAAIPYQIPEDMLQQLWWKFMMNVGINQTSAILRAPYGVFQRITEARELMENAAREVLLIAQKAGINLTEADIRSFAGIINGLSPEGKTSMLQDVEAGRKTEVEIFAGTVVELGKQYGVATPINEVLLRMIRTIEQRYQQPKSWH
ncbi:MAG TPA: ketopantoate reductase family protein [Bacillota bacterium]|jgi:2-dehydropantoate 2-reductase|nr:ketopantoate reductase family protein [Bacillota bacterium]HOL10237.1 ketopantoate reductase family protein [Bacillota bacterium]HPO98003.1 ketopantoate reductase family protein [Bacillota bacterium]